LKWKIDGTIKLAILNECHYLLTNSVYTLRKIKDLEITKLEIFSKTLLSASIKNWWGTYFKWTDVKKLTIRAIEPKMLILIILIYAMGKIGFHKITKKSGPI